MSTNNEGHSYWLGSVLTIMYISVGMVPCICKVYTNVYSDIVVENVILFHAMSNMFVNCVKVKVIGYFWNLYAHP